MKYLKKYVDFSINEAVDGKSIKIKNKGMSKEEEKIFLNQIVTFIQKADSLSDVIDNKIRIKDDDKIVVDKRGNVVLFKYKHDGNEKIKVFIKTELFEKGTKEDLINLLVEKGADSIIPSNQEEPIANADTANVKPQVKNWEEFNNKWAKLINIIKTEGVKTGVPILSTPLMMFLLTNKKDYVLFIQEFLNTNNGSTLVLDGKYGTNTSNEIKKFQETKQLNSDGIVGKLTWEKVMETISHPVSGLKAIGANTAVSSKVASKTTSKVPVKATIPVKVGVKEDLQTLKKITELFSVAFPDEDLENMAKSADCKITDNDTYQDIFGYYRYYAIDTFTDFNEEGWLNLFKKMNTNDLYYFIYHYNNTPHFYDGDTIPFDFSKDSIEGFDDSEMTTLSDTLQQKGIKVEGKKVTKK